MAAVDPAAAVGCCPGCRLARYRRIMIRVARYRRMMTRVSRYCRIEIRVARYRRILTRVWTHRDCQYAYPGQCGRGVALFPSLALALALESVLSFSPSLALTSALTLSVPTSFWDSALTFPPVLALPAPALFPTLNLALALDSFWPSHWLWP